MPTVVPLTFREFLRIERALDRKAQLVKGQLLLMEGASKGHLYVQGEAFGTLWAALGAGPCRAFGSDVKIRIPATDEGFYPDACVACPSEFVDDDAGVLANPCLVVEVLSKSTRRFDLGDKFASYATLPSLQEVLYLEPSRVHAELRRRAGEGWETLTFGGRAATVPLRSVGVDLSLAVLYRDL